DRAGDGGDGGGGRAPLRPCLHGRGSHRGLGRTLQRPRGERVRRIPRAAERLRRRRSADARRGGAPTIPRGAGMTPETRVKELATPHRLALRFADVPIGVGTNVPEFRARLPSSFQPYVLGGHSRPLPEVASIKGALPVSDD